MRKVLSLILLIGTLATVALAGDNTDSSSPAGTPNPPEAAAAVAAKPTVAKATGTQLPHVGTCCMPGAGPATGGTLFQGIFGDGLAKRGIYVENMLQLGVAINTASDPAGRAVGTSNYPVAGVPDQGFNFNTLSLLTHKDVTTDISPRGGPYRGAVPTKWSWGWFTEWTYGRNMQAARMYGWEMNWGINQPGAGNSALAAQNRQSFFAMQHEEFEIYMPFLKGVDIIIGRFAPSIGYEIPPSYRPGPDYFYSRAYAVPSSPVDTLGMLSAWNVMRSEKYGYVSAEFGINTGWMTVKSPNGRPNYQQSLRYRSPNMTSRLDYESMVGCGEVQPGAERAKYLPTYRVASPNCLMRQHHSINGTQTFGKWRAALDVYYGKMEGDKNAGTIYLLNNTHFNGAFYQGEYGQLVYQASKTLSYGARIEHFRNPNGYAIVPVSSVKSNFNSITVGPHYDFAKWVTLRPEMRYDFQTNNHGLNAFGLQNTKVNGVTKGTENHQVAFQMDMLLYF